MYNQEILRVQTHEDTETELIEEGKAEEEGSLPQISDLGDWVGGWLGDS